MDKNEQWLNGGNCDICRRKNYCSKLCKPAKLRQQAEIANVIANAMLKAISKGTSDANVIANAMFKAISKGTSDKSKE